MAEMLDSLEAYLKELAMAKVDRDGRRDEARVKKAFDDALRLAAMLGVDVVAHWHKTWTVSLHDSIHPEENTELRYSATPFGKGPKCAECGSEMELLPFKLPVMIEGKAVAEVELEAFQCLKGGDAHPQVTFKEFVGETQWGKQSDPATHSGPGIDFKEERLSPADKGPGGGLTL